MTTWNDPQWLDAWYQLLETPADANTAPDPLLKPLDEANPLRVEAQADWECHRWLQSYYESLRDNATDTESASLGAESQLPRPRQPGPVHPECCDPPPTQPRMPSGHLAKKTVISKSQAGGMSQTVDFVARCVAAAEPWLVPAKTNHVATEPTHGAPSYRNAARPAQPAAPANRADSPTQDTTQAIPSSRSSMPPESELSQVAAEEALLTIAESSAQQRLRQRQEIRGRRWRVHRAAWATITALSLVLAFGWYFRVDRMPQLMWLTRLGEADAPDAQASRSDDRRDHEIDSAASAKHEISANGARSTDPALSSIPPDRATPRPSAVDRAATPLAELTLPPALPLARYHTVAFPTGRWIIGGNSQWKTAPTPADQGDTTWELTAGNVDLELDSGLTCRLRGPATLRRTAAGDWLLLAGTVWTQWPAPLSAEQANIDSPRRPATFGTPCVDLSSPEWATCFVTVDPAGETLVQVTQGKLAARSRAIDASQPWQLAADKQWQAHFWPRTQTPTGDGRAPVAGPGRAVLVDRQGGFQGLIDVNGKILPWSSPQVFAQVTDTAKTKMEQGDPEFREQWDDLSSGWQALQESQLKFDGQQLSAPTFEDLWRMSQPRLPASSSSAQGSDASSTQQRPGPFQFDLKGTQMNFSSQEEFDQFMQRAMGPLFAEFQTLMTPADFNGLHGISNAPPLTANSPRSTMANATEDGSRQSAANSSAADSRWHQTPWGKLDGQTLLVAEPEAFAQPLRPSK